MIVRSACSLHRMCVNVNHLNPTALRHTPLKTWDSCDSDYRHRGHTLTKHEIPVILNQDTGFIIPQKHATPVIPTPDTGLILTQNMTFLWFWLQISIHNPTKHEIPVINPIKVTMLIRLALRGPWIFFRTFLSCLTCCLRCVKLMTTFSCFLCIFNI